MSLLLINLLVIVIVVSFVNIKGFGIVSNRNVLLGVQFEFL
jgi:hypothetical protein